MPDKNYVNFMTLLLLRLIELIVVRKLVKPTLLASLSAVSK